MIPGAVGVAVGVGATTLGGAAAAAAAAAPLRQTGPPQGVITTTVSSSSSSSSITTNEEVAVAGRTPPATYQRSWEPRPRGDEQPQACVSVACFRRLFFSVTTIRVQVLVLSGEFLKSYTSHRLTGT